jgi:hypothetical protein
MVKFALWIGVAGVLVACHNGSKSRGTGSGGAPIEIVNQVQLPDAGGSKSGPTTEEIEPNDGDDVATPLPLGGTARGKIEPDSDVDHYRIDVDKPGALSLLTTAIDTDLIVELEDASGTVVARSDRGGARTKEGIPNFGVTPGRYTAVVRAAPKKRPKPPKGRRAPEPEPQKPAPVYELATQLVQPGANTEHEPDEDRGTANDLIVGDTGIGYIGWTGDADVWKLSVETLNAKNAVDIEVSAVEGVALELDVDDGLGQQVLARKAPRGAALVVRGFQPIVAASSPPFHYLTIKGVGSNPETGYQIRVTQKLIATDAEVEPDDSPDHPFVMPTDRTIVHATWTPGDVDCFAIAPANAVRTVDATVAPGDFAAVAELLIDGKAVAIASKGGKGVEQKLAGVIPAGARAVVRVKNADANAATEASYDVTIQESATGPGDNAP